MNDEILKVSDERSEMLSAAGNEAFVVLQRHGLSVSEGLMVVARIAGVLEAGLFDVGEVPPNMTVDAEHEEIAQRIANEREGYIRMRDAARAVARPIQ